MFDDADRYLIYQAPPAERDAFAAMPYRYLVHYDALTDSGVRGGTFELDSDTPLKLSYPADPTELSDENPQLAWTYQHLRAKVPPAEARRGHRVNPDLIRITRIDDMD